MGVGNNHIYFCLKRALKENMEVQLVLCHTLFTTVLIDLCHQGWDKNADSKITRTSQTANLTV